MQPKSKQFLDEVRRRLMEDFRGCGLDFTIVPDKGRPYEKLIIRDSRRKVWEIKWQGDPIPRPPGDDSTYTAVNQCWKLYEYPAGIHRPKLVGRAGVNLEEVIEYIANQLPSTRPLSLF